VTSSVPNPDFRELLGSYHRVIATALEGVQVLTVSMIEAYENGDLDYARELAGILDENVGHFRNAFGFSKDIP